MKADKMFSWQPGSATSSNITQLNHHVPHMSPTDRQPASANVTQPGEGGVACALPDLMIGCRGRMGGSVICAVTKQPAVRSASHMKQKRIGSSAETCDLQAGRVPSILTASTMRLIHNMCTISECPPATGTDCAGSSNGSSRVIKIAVVGGSGVGKTGKSYPCLCTAMAACKHFTFLLFYTKK